MIMELYPEMNEKIKNILRVGGEPYLLYAAEYIERLEKQLNLAIAELKQAADDNGGCWGCKWLDEVTDECTSPLLAGMFADSTIRQNVFEEESR